MMSSIQSRLTSYWFYWAKRRNHRGNPQCLDSVNLYIMPSAFGWSYGLVLLTLFLCAVNYQISSVFLLTFLLTVAGMVSAWKSHSNLKGITISCLSIDDVAKGETAHAFLLVYGDNITRFNIHYELAGQNKLTLDLLPQEGKEIALALPTTRRGRFPLPYIRFSSEYPFGLFNVWGYAFFELDYYVFPNAISPGFWPETWTDEGKSHEKRIGYEDIDNLKPTANPWIEANRIAWKIAARGQGWYLKIMNAPESQYWLFRIEDLPAMDIEQALQHLSYWLQNAEMKGYTYGLEIKDKRTPFSCGNNHLKYCLRLLANY